LFLGRGDVVLLKYPHSAQNAWSPRHSLWCLPHGG
jgi:hypothetical protein